jgi:hypothetical protein
MEGVMRFGSDDHYQIGYQHVTAGTPCQDHALSGSTEEGAYAVVADGCSSGRHTDMGARLLSFTTAGALTADPSIVRDIAASAAPYGTPHPSHAIALRQRLALRSVSEMLGLEREDLLATCAYALVTPEGGFIHISGDGVAAIKLEDGSIRLWRFDWTDNMPFYLAYAEDSGTSFIAAHGGDEAKEALTSQEWLRAPGKDWEQVAMQAHSIAEGMRGMTIPLSASIKDGTLAYAAVFTDGVTQVEGVDWKAAVERLLSFKTTAGVFAKRRMKRFAEETKKHGHGPIDDIAYAVVHMGQS